jgi:serine/threonine protein kinase
LLEPGTRLGSYEIRSVIGAGGMGEVYKAIDLRLSREVAIKIADEGFTERFDHEARLIATLNHPNICTLHDVGTNYLVMELVEGETLRARLRRGLAVEASLEIARQMLEALAAAHRAGVVHRDLKPENVMIRSDGYVKVLDFGLAKRLPSVLDSESEETARVSLPGQIVGTLAYMSPEQVQGQPIDARSDLFALGIVLYEMLAGHHPWPRGSAIDVLHAILHDDPAAIGAGALDPELAGVVLRLLRKNPAERYSVAEGVSRDLARFGTTAGVATPPRQAPLTSIAILPFTLLSQIEESRALSLGFADALITILGNLENVAVAPTSAILQYASGTDAAGVCRDLGVRYALQGNVQKMGAQWRVSLQLFDASTQKITFSEKHDFELDHVFELQDEIGRRVVESLETRLPLSAAKSRDRYSSDAHAYGEFMSGLRASYSNQPDILDTAIGHLSAAVERDPQFALAHAWLSYVSASMHFSFDPRPARLDTAEHHCRRALLLDPALPEGHLARAWILWSQARNFQHLEALEALAQVLAVQPHLEQAHNRIAAICAHIGRLAEARVAHGHAQRSNPLTRSYNFGAICLYGGDFDRLEEVANGYLRDRGRTLYALYYHMQPPLMNGDLDLAQDRLAAAMEEHAGEPMLISLQGMLHARRRETGDALECVRRALDSPRSFGHTHHTHYQIACVYALLGEPDKAMAWLERTADTGFPCSPFFRVDPHLERLRETPAFTRLVADLERKYSAVPIRRL